MGRSKSRWRLLRISVGLIASALLIAESPALVRGQGVEIKFDFSPNISSEHRQVLQDTARFFLAFAADTFKRPMQRGGVIHAYENFDHLVEAYMKQHGTDKETTIRHFGYANSHAIAAPNHVWVYMRARCFRMQFSSPGCSLNKILIHELFHLWQYEFGERAKPPNVPYWMNEGSAEFAGYLGGQRMGAFTASEAMGYLASGLQEIQAAPRLSELESLSGWSRNQERGAVYETVVLAFFRLTGDHPEYVTKFYEGISRGNAWADAFREAFGVDFQTFEERFASYAGEVASQCPRLSQLIEQFAALNKLRFKWESGELRYVRYLADCVLKAPPGATVVYSARRYFWWAVAYLEGRFQDAYERVVRDVIGLEPRFWDGYITAGLIALRLGGSPEWREKGYEHLRRALEIIESAKRVGAPLPNEVRLKEDLAQIYYGLGEYYRFSGRCAEAERNYLLAQSAGPNWGANQASDALKRLPAAVCVRN